MGVSVVDSAASGGVNRSSAATAPSSDAPSARVMSSSRADQVSLSPLAASLHDESLTVFNALSDEQRGQISSLVESGRMSGEEVHDALKQRLKEARRGAYGGIRRMFANDNAELALNEGRTVDDLKDGLRSTLDRRSAIMDGMSELGRNGGAGSQAYKDLSDQLSARSINPLLNDPRATSMGMAFYEFDPDESRLMSTHKEGDAAYKLKATGFNLDELDRAIRFIGEKDATSIVLEKSGMPRTSTVAKDRDFSIDDAIIKPILGKSSGQAVGGGLPDIFGQAEARTLTATGTPGIYEIQGGGSSSESSRKGREALRNSIPPSDPAEQERKRAYQTGLFARY